MDSRISYESDTSLATSSAVSPPQSPELLQAVQNAVFDDEALTRFVDANPELALALLRQSFAEVQMEQIKEFAEVQIQLLEEEKERQRRVVKMVLRGVHTNRDPGASASTGKAPPRIQTQLRTDRMGRFDYMQNPVKRESRPPHRPSM